MAWTEQCCIAFVANATGLLARETKPNINKVIRDLSKDSGVPFKTLRRWWYANQPEYWANMKKSPKNGTHGTENEEKKETIMCSACGVEPARKNLVNKTGKILQRSTCNKCENQRRIRNKKYYVMCPHCGEKVLIGKNDLIEIKKEGSNE